MDPGGSQVELDEDMPRGGTRLKIFSLRTWREMVLATQRTGVRRNVTMHGIETNKTGLVTKTSLCHFGPKGLHFNPPICYDLSMHRPLILWGSILLRSYRVVSLPTMVHTRNE